jgi:hypothetical protein
MDWLFHVRPLITDVLVIKERDLPLGCSAGLVLLWRRLKLAVMPAASAIGHGRRRTVPLPRLSTGGVPALAPTPTIYNKIWSRSREFGS